MFELLAGQNTGPGSARSVVFALFSITLLIVTQAFGRNDAVHEAIRESHAAPVAPRCDMKITRAGNSHRNPSWPEIRPTILIDKNSPISYTEKAASASDAAGYLQKSHVNLPYYSYMAR